MSENKIFAGLLGISFLILLAQIQTLSISYFEAGVLYGEPSFLKYYIAFFLENFGSNDYALRLPMVGIHLLSACLLYLISAHYVTKKYDRIWIILIYLLLPGITSAALLVNIAGFKIAAIFAFVYLYLINEKLGLLILPLFLVFDETTLFFYFSLIVYGLNTRKFWTAAVAGLLILSLFFGFGINFGGKPEGHFLDTLGVYAAIFSPIVFVYIFYVLYRRYAAHERELLWSIASSMFLISLLLSFRQKVNVQDFAPYMMLALPLAAQTFFHTYRVRLSMFRKRYKFLFLSAFILLIVNALVVLFNPWLYRWIKNPKDHFSYPMHIAKELASELHAAEIECVDTKPNMQARLRFYGIEQCDKTVLHESKSKNEDKVTISYIGVPIYTVYVTKVNK